jgi:hypothetical protein
MCPCMCVQVQKALEGSKKYEVPRKWELLEEGFTAERGMMTPKMSIKRHIVMKVRASFSLCERCSCESCVIACLHALVFLHVVASEIY